MAGIVFNCMRTSAAVERDNFATMLNAVTVHAEGGGQVGDSDRFTTISGITATELYNTRKTAVIVHILEKRSWDKEI